MERPERALPVYLQTLRQSEALGEEILSDRQQVIELDNRRQINRQAIRSTQKCDGKVWVLLGNEFIKLNKNKVSDWLNNDQKVLDEEIDKLRDGLKDKVDALHKLEGKAPVKGFDLKPLKAGDVSKIIYE